jgi:hypothetical protein
MSDANLRRPFSEMNQKYVRKYKKRIEREIQNQDPVAFMENDKKIGGASKNTEDDNENDLKYLSKLDSIDLSRRRNVLVFFLKKKYRLF